MDALPHKFSTYYFITNVQTHTIEQTSSDSRSSYCSQTVELTAKCNPTDCWDGLKTSPLLLQEWKLHTWLIFAPSGGAMREKETTGVSKLCLTRQPEIDLNTKRTRAFGRSKGFFRLPHHFFSVFLLVLAVAFLECRWLVLGLGYSSFCTGGRLLRPSPYLRKHALNLLANLEIKKLTGPTLAVLATWTVQDPVCLRCMPHSLHFNITRRREIRF